MQSMPEVEQTELLIFPTEFPIKVMGKTQPGFAQEMLAVVLKHAPSYQADAMEMRASREGNYLSLTFTVNAESREQLDALYRDFSAHPMVKMAL